MTCIKALEISKKQNEQIKELTKKQGITQKTFFKNMIQEKINNETWRNASNIRISNEFAIELNKYKPNNTRLEKFLKNLLYNHKLKNQLINRIHPNRFKISIEKNKELKDIKELPQKRKRLKEIWNNIKYKTSGFLSYQDFENKMMVNFSHNDVSNVIQVKKNLYTEKNIVFVKKFN